MKKIAIFASGSGTNAENIIRYFKTSKKIKVALVLSNNKNAFVLQRANKLNVETKAELDKFKQYENESYDELVRKVVRIVWMCKKQPSLSQKTIKEIEAAR